MRTVLCVAEKPSIAKSVAQILSGGDLQVVRSIYFLLCYFVIQGTDALPLHARLCAQQNSSRSKYIKNYEFDYNYARSRFIVTSVVGHLMETDFYDTHRKWGSCDPFELFDAPVKVVIAQDKQPIEQNLMTLARRCDVLMIWTDCDREGEHIGKEIASVCARGKPGIVVQRARFSAIIPQCVFFFWLWLSLMDLVVLSSLLCSRTCGLGTMSRRQIHHAAQNPIELDHHQAAAVEARIALDLKIGAAFTRLQTLTLQDRVNEISDQVVSYGMRFLHPLVFHSYPA